MLISTSTIDTNTSSGVVLTQKDTDAVIKLLDALPDGVAEMSSHIAGLVETSNNIATVELTTTSLVVLSFQRSSVKSKLGSITSKIRDAAVRLGANVRNVGGFPVWEPNMDSPLLQRSKKVYRETFGKEPKVSIVHGGLENNVIRARYPNIDMIAFGPTIENPHSPDERLYIPSIRKVWDFLVLLLKSYKP